MANLEAYFKQTFEDKILSREERRTLAKLLKEETLDSKEMGILRAKVFDFAQDHMEDHESEMTLEWLYQVSKLLVPKGKIYEHKVLFSPGSECLQAITQHIRDARNRLDICVFTISDDRISGPLMQAHRAGVEVRIITDNDKMYDRGSDVQQLKDAGLSVRVDMSRHHMHHKFAVVDQQVALTGSYNWTRSAAEHNEENLLISNDPGIILSYQKKFNELWPQMKELD